MGFDIKTLRALGRRPGLTGHSTDFWSDPYISAHVLNAHLDPDHEAGSRKPERIGREAAWMAETLRRSGLPAFGPLGSSDPHEPTVPQARLDGSAGPPLILDLGCGPGLYARHFLAAGFDVLGLDFSPASIAHARLHAARSVKPRPGSSRHACADFQCVDFTRAQYPEQSDGAVMVYGIFGNLHESERDRVFDRLTRSLRPGGRFVFDVFGKAHALKEALQERWYYAAKDGFWQAGPHLVLEKSWTYEEKQTVLNCYYLLDAEGTLRTRIVRHRWYGQDEIRLLLEARGLKLVAFEASLAGSPPAVQEDWFAVVAERA